MSGMLCIFCAIYAGLFIMNQPTSKTKVVRAQMIAEFCKYFVYSLDIFKYCNVGPIVARGVEHFCDFGLFLSVEHRAVATGKKFYRLQSCLSTAPFIKLNWFVMLWIFEVFFFIVKCWALKMNAKYILFLNHYMIYFWHICLLI